MQTMTLTADTTAMSREPAPRAAARTGEDLYEFRRYNYADGWDSDDADLGWVDEDIVGPRTRRVH